MQELKQSKFFPKELLSIVVSYLTDEELAYIRSHGNDDSRNIARIELLKRYKQLTPMDYNTLFTAVHMFCPNPTGAIRIYGPIELWDISGVTDMSYIFSNFIGFNADISNWDVSNVTNMFKLFYNTKAFNQDISNWDVSNVINMSGMFYNAKSFNQPLNNWNVSNVTDMKEMFKYANSFNQPLNNWDVSNVTDMKCMFKGAFSFNQPLDGWNISSNTINTIDMFHNTQFIRPLNTRSDNKEKVPSNCTCIIC